MKNHLTNQLSISKLIGIILFIFFLSFSITYGQKTDQPTYPSQNPVMTLEERLSNNESLMTLDEKVAFLSSNPGVERMGIKRMRQVEDQHGLTQGTQYITTQKNKSKTIAPQKLKHTDIGNPAIAGKADITAKGFDITAGGADIWGKRDEFHFSYQTLKGDFDFNVQILSMSKAHQYTKAGIMARTDLTDNSQHVYFQIFPDNSPRNKNNGGCEFQYRMEKAGEMKAIYPDLKTAGNQFDVAFPDTWIRLKRAGDVFESFVGNDNKNWRLYSTFTMKMPAVLYVGTAVTSHNTTVATIVKFGSVQLRKL